MGSGTPEQARRFTEQERVPGTLVTDPSLAAYRIAGMKRGVLKTLNPKSALSAVRALGRGHMQGANAGDPWQQGGVLVVDAIERGGRVLLQHASSEAGDPTDFAAVARALDALAGDA